MPDVSETTRIQAVCYAGEHDPELFVELELSPGQERELHRMVENLPAPFILGEVEASPERVEVLSVLEGRSLPESVTEPLYEGEVVGGEPFPEDPPDRENLSISLPILVLQRDGFGFRFYWRGKSYRSQGIEWEDVLATQEA